MGKRKKVLVTGVNDKNFIKTTLNVGKKYPQVKVVNDQIGTPTYTYDLARLLVDMAESDKYGYYHATNEVGYISWKNMVYLKLIDHLIVDWISQTL